MRILAAKILLVIAAIFSGNVSAQMPDIHVFSGDVRLACEAILCLSSSVRPSECAPSLNRYFGIKKKRLSSTLKARRDFLHMCPVVGKSLEMMNFVDSLAYGAGRCDADSLNASQMIISAEAGTRFIGNVMPSYCSVYASHEYTNLGDIMPIYVGVPERGGRWVEAEDYPAALAEYNARIAAEDKQRWIDY